jgi:hypothetical protein
MLIISKSGDDLFLMRYVLLTLGDVPFGLIQMFQNLLCPLPDALLNAGPASSTTGPRSQQGGHG